MIDVCLVLEGSYPYVTGGVSEWVDGLLHGLPDVSFAVAHVHHEDTPERAAAYAAPANLASLVCVGTDPERSAAPPGAERALPAARVYHAACTGAAGLLAERAADAHGAGFAMTEHGIAWREARFGVTGCKPGGFAPSGCKPGGFAPSGCKPGGLHSVDAGTPAQRRAEAERHARRVTSMARRAYARADAITSVCSVNAALQQAMGAPPARLRVLANPVATGGAKAASRAEGPFRAALVGRVVAIKDVETFLRACALVVAECPEAEFAVVGPLDHEPEYAARCVALAEALGLAEQVTFTGTTDPAAWYAKVDAVVLTSVSEAQPLVLLEAMAAGLPVVATDVGGCREAVGDAGLLTPPGAPRATAEALLALARDPALRERLGAAGRRRVARRHDPATLYGAYGRMYDRLAG